MGCATKSCSRIFNIPTNNGKCGKNSKNSSRGGRHREQTTTATEKRRTKLTATSWLEREGHNADIDRPGAEFTVFGALQDFPAAGAGVALAGRKIALASNLLSPSLADAAVALYSGIEH